MTAKTDALEDMVVHHFLRGVSQGSYSGYVGLFTTMPNDAGVGGVEVSAAGYSRQAGGFIAPTTPGETNNGALVAFGPAGASWGTILGFGVWTASSGGTLLYYGTLAASKTVDINDIIEFPAGQLEISEL